MPPFFDAHTRLSPILFYLLFPASHLIARYDGLFISNGPGDPTKCEATIKQLQMAMEKDVPIFGICLGNQLLALAAGCRTYKMKYGNRGANQPCIDTRTNRCYITAQNHGFAVDADSLPAGWQQFFVNANDGTNEGIIHQTKPCAPPPPRRPGRADPTSQFPLQFPHTVPPHQFPPA